MLPPLSPTPREDTCRGPKPVPELEKHDEELTFSKGAGLGDRQELDELDKSCIFEKGGIFGGRES